MCLRAAKARTGERVMARARRRKEGRSGAGRWLVARRETRAASAARADWVSWRTSGASKSRARDS